MTTRTRRFAQALAAGTLTVLMLGVGTQNTSAQGPGPGGRFGGAGGPMGRRGPGGPFGPGPGGALGPMLGQLNLSSEQQDRVKQILDSHGDEQQALAKRGMAARQALQDAVTSSTFDEASVRTRAADVAAVDADAAVAQARIYTEVFQILTADQQKKLQDLQANMKSRMQQMEQRRQNRPERQRQ